MRIGVVGGGVVGQATARCFLEHVDEVRVYDLVSERRTHGITQVLNCELVFVCLPTPQKANSLECDTSAMGDFFSENKGCSSSLVLRSTVPVGTTRRLREQHHIPNLVHSPEFLTARCAVTDAQMPARNVIGVPRDLVAHPADPNYTQAGYIGKGSVYATLHDLYERRFPGVPIHHMTSDESEAVKLFQNSIFATTIALWNELQHLAERAGLDWERVRAAILADGRLSSSHTKVPGPDGLFGYGGACLPKDLASFVHQYRELLGTGPWVTKAAMIRNEEVDRKRQ